MKTQKKFSVLPLRSRMVFRLWSIMMVLVLFGIGFMWIAQIYLFEQNYAKTALAGTQQRLEPVMESLAMGDLADDPRLISYLSHITNGELILMNQQGKLLQMYSSGHRVNIQEQREEQKIWKSIRKQEQFQDLLAGRPYRQVNRHRNQIVGYELGFPVTYGGEPCFVILRNALMLKTTLDLNRRQLIILTVMLTGIASLLAAVLSRQFTKPIDQIKDAVDRLTHNDFSARPRLEREDELGQLSRSVDQLGEALQRVDRLRKEVIANVSHELRSPLAVIGGYAEMVRDITWKDNGQREENLNLIIREARRMSDMVDDILDYSQLQAGYLQLKKGWHDLYGILEAETAFCRPGAMEHHILLELACPRQEIWLFIDPLKIRQVIRNLLYNAINHTEEGQKITLNALSGPYAFHVSISNPGPPIPMEEREIIWERYQRSQHQNGRRLGTGIGLSIVSTILEAHGMAYGVECRDGWIHFWFDCPVTPKPAPGPR